jgi:hypothetical protein
VLEATITAAAVGIGFLLVGDAVLSFLGVSVGDFQAAAGGCESTRRRVWTTKGDPNGLQTACCLAGADLADSKRGLETINDTPESVDRGRPGMIAREAAAGSGTR